MADMRVYLVRHTSVDVPRGVCYGQSDVPLRDTFPREASVVKEKLEFLVQNGFLPHNSPLDGERGERLSGNRLDFDAVYTSPLSRCTRLADFCGYGDALREPRIMEMNFGEWEMQDYNSIGDPRLQEWYEDYLHVKTTGGESFDEQFNRVAAFLQQEKASGKRNILCFCHGGVLICAKILQGAVTPDKAFSALDDYGSVIEIVL